MIKTETIYNAKRFKNIREILVNAVENYPDNTAFIIKQKNKKEIKYRNITFKEFYNDINYLGTALINKNLKDKKVAIIGKNRYEWCLSYLAVINGVGTVVPLDKGLPEKEIESLLIRSQADSIIFEDSYIDIIKRIKEANKTKVKE